MDTPLSATASKWIGTNGKALWPGDLINNHGSYNVAPNYKDSFWKLAHINAERFSSSSSSYRAMYARQAMFVCAMSGGWAAWRTAEHFLPRILEHSMRLSGESDEAFFTPWRAGDVLDNEVMASDIYAQNARNNKTAVMVAAHSIRNPDTNERDLFIVGPAQRESFSREMNKSHAISRGIKYEDAIYEKHFWGPAILMDMSHMILHGDHAWSRNGSLEKGIALSIQYGSPLPMMVRRGQQMDVVDIQGRPVSVVDQAWEDARHLVYEVTRTYTYGDEDFKARSETAAALMLSRFMHDHLWRTNVPVNKGGLDKANAHDVVKAHYASDSEMKRMDDLRDIMLPFLAAHCNWPTLHKILGNDPALKAFWDKQVAPTAPKVKSDADIQSAILSYLPRGGFRVPELDAFVKISADPPAARTNFNTRDIEAVIKATLAHGFAGEYDPEIYNDRSFAKLGRNRHPRHEPDPDHYTFEQATAVMALGALGDGVVPLDRPKTYLYLDDPAGGHAAAAYMQRTGIVDPTQIGAAYDVHGNPGESFGDVVGRESSADFVDRQRELGLAHEYAQFRRDKGIGNILSLTDFRGALNYTGRREATDTEAHEAVAADGSMHQSKDTLEAVARRATTLAMDGIIIPAGMTSSLQARIIGEALTVAIGKVKRGGENMDYQMEFLMDFDYDRPVDKRDPKNIVKLDLADLIIHVGIQVKALLEQPNTPACPDLYITMARLLDVYERMIDPARRNTVVDRDPRTGKDKRKEIIAIDEIDPYFKEFISSRSPVASYQETGDHHIDNPARDAFFSRPEYKALAAPEASKPKDFYKQLLSRTSSLGGLGAKAALAHDIWAWMRAAAIPSPSGKPGQNWAVTGNLLARGIQYFDDMSLTDLHPDYRAAQTAWGNLNARQRANIFGQHQLQVEGPTVAR